MLLPGLALCPSARAHQTGSACPGDPVADSRFLHAEADAKHHSDNLVLVTRREILRQEAVLAHVRRAQCLERAHDALSSQVEYRLALALDPQNAAARIGMAAALPPDTAAPPPALRIAGAAPPVALLFDPAVHEFHFRGTTRGLLAAVADAYGLRAFVQDALPDSAVKFDLAQAHFAQAMEALRALLHVGWIALDPHTVYFGLLTPGNDFQPLAVRTFYLRDSVSVEQMSDLNLVLRNILGMTHVQLDTAARAMTVRDTPERLDQAEKVLLDLEQNPGEVILEVRILEVERNIAEKLGVDAPYTFQLFTLAPLLAQLRNIPNLQDLLQQLFQQGGLNGLLNGGQIGTALAQLQQQISPLLQNPFIVFGGGATLMALTVPRVNASLSNTSSVAHTVESALLRSSGGAVAELKIGERYPIVNASFSPIVLNAAIAKVLGNGSFLQPFPSFTFEDLGLDLKLTPRLSGDHEVDLKLEAHVRALNGEAENGVPLLSNREVDTSIRLRDGEPALVAGLFSSDETLSLSGVPGLSAAPGIGWLFASRQTHRIGDQLMIVLIPHIVQERGVRNGELWIPPIAVTGR